MGWFFPIIALFIAFIWIRYFRDIDIFEREKWGPMVLSFFLGACSVALVFWISPLLGKALGLRLSGNWLDDFLFIFIKVAGLEELAKVLAFGLSFLLMRKQFNEPLDYLIYCSLSALGFSAFENILYFNSAGASIIVARGILSTVGHMFNTALFAYGIILFRFRYQKSRPALIILFFILAALAHTFYNFPLMHQGMRLYGYLLTLVYFLSTISIYAAILNNALNQSPFFSYQKVIDSTTVSSRLLTSYILLFFIQLGLMYWEDRDLGYSLMRFKEDMITTGFVVLVSSVRLSRFLLIKGRWHPLRLELPFSFGQTGSGNSILSHRFRIKGDAYNAVYLHRYWHQWVRVKPVPGQEEMLLENARAYIESKHFIQGDLAVYKALLEQEGISQYYGIAPKLRGSQFIGEEKYPIAALFEWPESFDDPTVLAKTKAKKLKLLGWVALIPSPKNDSPTES
tara:strand:- start:202 stop:1566 length:1365 start_codon:yes stop_codon:yes gene_type:complete